MEPLVYTVILTWNNGDDAIECLESFHRLDYSNHKIVVVDNASTDDTIARVRERFPQLRILENRANLGYAEGNNVGIRYALENGADYVFILNDDTVVAPEVLALLIQAGEQDESIGMLGPRVVSYTNHSLGYLGASIDWTSGTPLYVPATASAIQDAEYLAGCALLVKAKVAREIGFFDPAYFCYFEDADWGIRCRRAGYRCVTVPQAEIYHKGTPDNSKHLSMRSGFYYWRNQYLFMRRYAGGGRLPSFLLSYTYLTCKQFYLLTRKGEGERANMVIAGFWSAMTSQFGTERHDAPGWFKRAIFCATSTVDTLAHLTSAMCNRNSR